MIGVWVVVEGSLTSAIAAVAWSDARMLTLIGDCHFALRLVSQESLLFRRSRSGNPERTLGHLRLIPLLKSVDCRTSGQLFSCVLIRSNHVLQLGVHLPILSLDNLGMLLQLEDVVSLLLLLQVVNFHQTGSLFQLGLHFQILRFEVSLADLHLSNFIANLSSLVINLRVFFHLSRNGLFFDCDTVLQARNLLGKFLTDLPRLLHLLVSFLYFVFNLTQVKFTLYSKKSFT